MNGAEEPESRLRVLRRALMYFSGVGAARGQVSVHLAVTRPTVRSGRPGDWSFASGEVSF
jgi:hypothetical protein